MAVEVVTPDEYMGDVIGDLHARRGKVAGMTVRHGVQAVAGVVPLATMFGYATDLRSEPRVARRTRCSSITTQQSRSRFAKT